MGKRKFLDRLIEKTLKAHTTFETPSILNRLCKKYPDRKFVFWLLWQIKEYAIYLFWLWIIILVSTNCNPYVICKPCIDILNPYGLNPFNQTMNISNLSFVIK